MLESYLICSDLLKKYKAMNLDKLKYLAIIVDSEEAHEISKVTELLHWLAIAGVKNVCLYDAEGKVDIGFYWYILELFTNFCNYVYFDIFSF